MSNERDRDARRKRQARSEAARIEIPAVADPGRRAECLADPAHFLKTYMPERFYNPWATHHIEMIKSIVTIARHGGDQAIAAPRGDGKTEICAGMIAYCILAELIRFPVIIAATGELAFQIFRDIKDHFEHNELLSADFPEISVPVISLQGAPQRAAKQHVGGVLTRIEWTQDHVIFPHVPESPYGGVCLSYRGLDSAIRGIRFRGVRPDFVLLDDPETKESAKSESQIKDRTSAIDRDIAGLAGPNRILARVMLTTLQNRQCLSATYTDPKKRPSWNGKRFPALIKWPDARDKWEEYLFLRQQEQGEGLKDTPKANQYYLDNQTEMDAGAVVSNPYRFSEGESTALQAFFNRIVDWGGTDRSGLAAVMAELQNDPEDDTDLESIGLTSAKVQSRLSGYAPNILPGEGCRITVGLDIGKFLSHWVKVAWLGNATGLVIDYGVMQTPGLGPNSDSKAIEIALLQALMEWRTEIISVNQPEFCLIDSGTYSDAIYEFVRRVGGVPFAASKGWDTGRFSMGKESSDRRLFNECYALRQEQERVWLYHVHTEHWKHWVHERFNTPTYNDANQINDGSLSLFVHSDRHHHKAFAHHIVAEERREIFVPGKGVQIKWVQNSRNNHWLDATALACAAAGVLGVRLVQRITEQELVRAAAGESPPKTSPAQARVHRPHNRISRPGGWIRGMK